MRDVTSFGWVVLGVSLAAAVAILSNRLSEWIRVPAPALFLVGAALASDIFPALNVFDVVTVQRVVTVALVLILFEGGMHIGWRRFRSAAGAIIWVGLAGTVVTAAAVSLLAHLVLGFDWQVALLLGAALSPTDPAVVFSVLGRREIVGRSGVLLEGESGTNDPVGISLMVVLVGLAGGAGISWSGVAAGIGEFALQMVVGGVVGLLGGAALLWTMRRLPLPNEGLYPLRTVVFAGVLYGAATVAHGSGFLAVFVAGILIGDANAPYKREIERFHSALSSLAEIVAFIVLGLTISLEDLDDVDALWPGLTIAVVLAFVIRPILVGVVLLPVRLSRGERVFVLWSGLKGAVPILLGTFAFTSAVEGASRIYEIIFVVVAFSVIVQGGLVPLVAHRSGVPMRVVEPEPWALGMRFREEPAGLRRYEVVRGSPADGTAIGDLALGENIWISLISRAGQQVPVSRDAVLAAGDEVLALTDTGDGGPDPVEVFGRKLSPGHP
jgi:cell volume regulation protein A